MNDENDSVAAVSSPLPDMTVCSPVKPGNVIRLSWALCKHNLPLLLSIAAIGQGLVVFRLALGMTGVGALWWVAETLRLPGIVVSLWSGVAMIIAASARHRGRRVTLRECFVEVEGRFLFYTMATVFYVLICCAGLLALVVPGVIYGTILSLGGYVAVLEGTIHYLHGLPKRLRV